MTLVSTANDIVRIAAFMTDREKQVVKGSELTRREYRLRACVCVCLRVLCACVRVC
jgi:hypothetical protein